MSDFSRRRFLKSGLALGAGASIGFPSLALADGWAELPNSIWGAGFEGYKVLEIFCYGGMSQWENFWVSEGTQGNIDWKNFSPQINAMNWACSGSPSPAAETNAFALDSSGNQIYWGPATKPLWRTGIFDRARMVTLSHDLMPHGPATYLSLTGRRLGSSGAAGLGAAIQHRAQSISPRALPYSYVLSHDNMGSSTSIEQPMIATGRHPGASRPLLIRTGDAAFVDELERTNISGSQNQLTEFYNEQYRDRLRFQGVGDALRSAGYSSFDNSLSTLLNSSVLTDLLQGDVLVINNSLPCATYPTSIVSPASITPPTELANRTGTALKTAVKALTTGGGRYACAIDRGILAASSGRPYDTHTNHRHAETNGTNIFNLATELAALIDDNGSDPNKLNLDDTVIVINTEFGRQQQIEASTVLERAGRNHHPSGYVSTIIGGPVQSRGIAGSLNSNGFASTASSFSPTDVHGAMMLAAGVDPFASENFGVSEFSSNVQDGTEQGTRENLKNIILGA